jgi:hypothetical protein
MGTELLDWAESQARKCDPETSKEAASKLQPLLSGLHFTFLNKLREIGPATANEVACSASRIKSESIRKRAGELLRRGKIRIVGVRECKVTGSKASVYEVCE